MSDWFADFTSAISDWFAGSPEISDLIGPWLIPMLSVLYTIVSPQFVSRAAAAHESRLQREIRRDRRLRLREEDLPTIGYKSHTISMLTGDLLLSTGTIWLLLSTIVALALEQEADVAPTVFLVVLIILMISAIAKYSGMDPNEYRSKLFRGVSRLTMSSLITSLVATIVVAAS